MNDKTIIRPGGRGPKKGKSDSATDDDKTEVRSSNRRQDPSKSDLVPEPTDLPDLDGTENDGLSDKTIIRPGGKRPRKERSDSVDDDRTEVRSPVTRQDKDKSDLVPEPTDSPEADGLGDKTIIRPGGKRPRKEHADSADDDDKTQVRTSGRRQASDEPISTTKGGTDNTGPLIADDDETIVRDELDAEAALALARSPPATRGPLIADDDPTIVRDELGVKVAETLPLDPDDRTMVRGADSKSQTEIASTETRAQQDPPFSEGEPDDDNDRTMVSTGGRKVSPNQAEISEDRRRDSGARAQISPETLQFVVDHKPDIEGETAINLVTPLLMVVGQMQGVGRHPNISELREYVIKSIRHFEAMSFGFRGDEIKLMSRACSYGLCVFVDDVVLSTPWGLNSEWPEEPLVEVFHPDLAGTDHFFEMLDDMMNLSASHLPALELYYLCLEMGYEGKYRDVPNGGRTVHDLRNKLYESISANSTRHGQVLSNRWEGITEPRNTILKQIPYWVILAVSLGFIVAGFVAFNFLLSSKSDATRRALAEISMREPAAVLSAPLREALPIAGGIEPDLVRNAVTRIPLETLLATEIDRGYVDIVEQPDKTILRLSHPDMFRSGTHTVSDQFVTLVESISTLLKDLDSRILITGHTDDVPIRSLKYPSNWELSKARADSVKEIMVLYAGLQGRVRTQGLADTVNLESNDSARSRAINRRVEIVLNK
jgi:type VI secretion system protein ImpK